MKMFGTNLLGLKVNQPKTQSGMDPILQLGKCNRRGWRDDTTV